MFKTIDEVKNAFYKENYITNKDIEYAILNAIRLELPLLVDGPAGVGKTELAKVIAKIYQTEMIRVSCYEGIDFSKVLYDFNYSKQLLYINLLKDNIKDLLNGKDFNESISLLNQETNFYGNDFLIERPILKAISPTLTNKKVLLIDEIDKSDMEFEAFLLEVLSDFSVTIPEYGTIECNEKYKPIVILTSNNVRELSEALKRRCIYLYIDYPSIEVEAKIIELKVDVNHNFSLKVANTINKIRNLQLKQKPSIFETILWTKTLLNNFGVNAFDIENKEQMIGTLGVLLKNKKDIDKLVLSKCL